MATGRKTVVVGQVIDPVAWGNPLWDQSIQQFASDPDRTAQFPTAQRRPGAATWLDDVKRWEGWDGAQWVPLRTDLAPVAVASLTANTGINPGAYYPIGASGSAMTTEVRGISYDATTGRFTVPRAGLYRVTWSTSWQAI